MAPLPPACDVPVWPSIRPTVHLPCPPAPPTVIASAVPDLECRQSFPPLPLLPFHKKEQSTVITPASAPCICSMIPIPRTAVLTSVSSPVTQVSSVTAAHTNTAQISPAVSISAAPSVCIAPAAAPPSGEPIGYVLVAVPPGFVCPSFFLLSSPISASTNSISVRAFAQSTDPTSANSIPVPACAQNTTTHPNQTSTNLIPLQNTATRPDPTSTNSSPVPALSVPFFQEATRHVGGGDGNELKEGSQYESFQEFQAAYTKWAEAGNHPMAVRRSHLFSGARKEDKVSYDYVIYTCKHYGNPRLRGNNVRPH